MIRKSTNDLSIRPKMSTTVLMALVVGGLFVVFAGLYFAFKQGVANGHNRLEADQVRISQFNDELVQAKMDLEKAREGLIFAQRQQQIQEEAYKQINKAYANSEQKNAVLGSRLDFYRSIISPEDGQSGPAIQALSQVYTEGQLSFDITLVQAIKHKHQVRGNLVVTLFENDQPTGRWPTSSPRSVSYQYFQQVSGKISKTTLTANAKVKVELVLQDGETLERWFNVGSINAAVGAE